MGVLSDIIVATEEEARSGAADIHVDSPDRLDLKGIDIVPLAALHCILSRRERDFSAIDEFPLVFQESDQGPWISRFPDIFSANLARLDPDGLEEAAQCWAAIGELDGLGVEGAKNVIRWLTSLVARAAEQGKHVYCWMSL